ncbi:CDP-glucose 4,6-dehydratase [Desulfonatronovibrio magnus]|uniref:CDP-glucose 4,6-dehydratase n=1 Tax=Desulfonatronovibrio magnus TaxID=698827 RepID=UPI0005EB1C36|nr:CDP-glucose 4,6-dehydratase [Desulfonatronovibrio magnus]
MDVLFADIYRDKKIFITGHTGFKGSWLAFWLTCLGADVTGFALEPDTDPSHFKLLNLPMRSIIGDIRDPQALSKAILKTKPEIVFHLAAQPLVRLSYKQPVETFSSNVMGTIHLFEACRKVDTVRAIVNITSDKCYENREWVWGYRESDPMGGHDPYSASKGCAELVTSSWRNSFFHPDQYGRSHQTLLASARAGNVIGGGDWGEDRIITDLVTAASQGRKLIIRNPSATRPWQHVLEPLSGYLLLGQCLLEGDAKCADAWNFGPGDEDSITVLEVVQAMQGQWDHVQYDVKHDTSQPHEAGLLKLDCSKSRSRLDWKPVWSTDSNFNKTISWYKSFYDRGLILTSDNLKEYISYAKQKQICWARR